MQLNLDKVRRDKTNKTDKVKTLTENAHGMQEKLSCNKEINEILAGKVKEIINTPEGQVIVYTLKYGSKEVRLVFTPYNGEATTGVKKIGKKEEERPNETTILHLAAKKLIEEEALASGQSINYLLHTGDDKIRDWANTTGKEIFAWDSAEIVEGNWYIFSKEIEPGSAEKAA